MWGNSFLERLLYKNSVHVVLSVCISMLAITTLKAYADVTLAPIHADAPQTLEELRLSDPAEVAKLPRL